MIEELNANEVALTSGGMDQFAVAAAGLGLLAAVVAAPEIAIIAAGYGLASAFNS